MNKFNPEQYGEYELESTTVRLAHKTKEKLATIAQEKNISMNSLIVRMIEYALENMAK